MPPDQPLQDVTRLIQLSVAPVFLLMSAASILSVLSTRLARIVDRGRSVERELRQAGAEAQGALREELGTLVRRIRLVHLAMTCAGVTALCLCLLIAAAFVGFVLDARVAGAIATLFVLASVAFAAALVLFLREVFVAIATFRLGVARPAGR
jgi:hypothetical protein